MNNLDFLLILVHGQEMGPGPPYVARADIFDGNGAAGEGRALRAAHEPEVDDGYKVQVIDRTLGPYPQVKNFTIILVTVTGDEATAMVSRLGVAGETVEEVIPLVRQDGRWLIDGIPGL